MWSPLFVGGPRPYSEEPPYSILCFSNGLPRTVLVCEEKTHGSSIPLFAGSIESQLNVGELPLELARRIGTEEQGVPAIGECRILVEFHRWHAEFMNLHDPALVVLPAFPMAILS